MLHLKLMRTLALLIGSGGLVGLAYGQTSQAEPAAPLLAQGALIFKSRCSVCHGLNADGKYDLANLMNPKPANLRASVLTLAQRERIVRKGGEAVGRSSNMPTWELELHEDELQAVIAYVGSISAKGH